jgi:class 3 adenylate cyclase
MVINAGDAVNVTSRLSDLSGSEQILINESVSKQISNLSSVRSTLSWTDDN